MPPKYSVLLPTKNRLELLKGAIETVALQSFGDWEIIVSDNCSTDDVIGYVSRLCDPRIKVSRSEVPLSVTDNWNRAINRASGDYIVMLGDDDGLAPNYFSRMNSLIAEFADPDLIYMGAYHFAFPGVIPSIPEGYLKNVTKVFPILYEKSSAYIVPKARSERAAINSLRLIAEFGYNMQYFLYSRNLIERVLKYGEVYQGAFPDYYAANVGLLLSEKTVAVPEPLVIIGISPKSFGNYYFNDKAADGLSFLSVDKDIANTPDDVLKHLLPGSILNNCWVTTVALIPQRLQRKDLSVDIARYRRLQIFKAANERGRQTIVDMWLQLSVPEKALAVLLKLLSYAFSAAPGGLGTRLMQRMGRLPPFSQYAPASKDTPPMIIGKYPDRRAVFDDLSRAQSSDMAAHKA
jgi:glycosyltransferase involved in cell wall biosynthesis